MKTKPIKVPKCLNGLDDLPTKNDIKEAISLLGEYQKITVTSIWVKNKKQLKRFKKTVWVEMSYLVSIYGFPVYFEKTIPEKKILLLLSDGNLKMLDL